MKGFIFVQFKYCVIFFPQRKFRCWIIAGISKIKNIFDSHYLYFWPTFRKYRYFCRNVAISSEKKFVSLRKNCFICCKCVQFNILHYWNRKLWIFFSNVFFTKMGLPKGFLPGMELLEEKFPTILVMENVKCEKL